MKKNLLLGLSCLSALCSSAQTSADPLILPEFYAFKISPDGRWLYSNTGSGEIIIYDLVTNNHAEFYDIDLGNGNTIAIDGTAVGSTNDGKAVIIKGEEEIYPAVFSKYWYGSPSAITADATRITGVVGNNATSDYDDEHQTYLPFVADINEAGEVADLTFLPHPDKDFFGLVPQYCSAKWISNDGKVVLGQLVDNSGMFLQPIVYREGADGEWSYSLPSESLFNPENIPLPEYPGEFTLKPVDPTDFMSPEAKEQFLEDKDWWESEGNHDLELSPYEHLEDYMTPEEIEEYNRAIDKFNEAAMEFNEKITLYYEACHAIMETSVSFLRNAFALNGDGTIAALVSDGAIAIDEWTMVPAYVTYILNIADESLTEVKSKYSDVIPTQVLDGGIVIGSTGSSEVQATYVYLPEAEDYIPVEEYFAQTTPLAAQWLQKNLVQALFDGTQAMISGCGVASDDFTVFASGVPAYMFDEELVYYTYVFSDLTSGVKEVAAEANSGLRVLPGGVIAVSGEVTDLSVVDLSGRKVFGVDAASGNITTGLSRGIYVITYTDAQLQRVSRKVAL